MRLKLDTKKFMSNGRVCPVLIDPEEGSVYCKLAVNVDGVNLAPDEFILHASASDLLFSLLRAGLVASTNTFAVYGYGVEQPILKLLRENGELEL